MNTLLRLARFAYRIFIGLYPYHYRREYAEELYQIFDYALQDASIQGLSATLRFLGRELRILPGALTRQNIFERNLLSAGQLLPGPFLSAALQKRKTWYTFALITALIAIFWLFFNLTGGAHMNFMSILIITGAYFLLPIGIALLVVWITGRQRPDQTPRRRLLTLFGSLVLVLALLNIAILLNPYGRKINSSLIGIALLPILVALLAALFLNAKAIASLWVSDKLILLGLGAASLVLFMVLWLVEQTTFYIIVGLALGLASIWIVGTRLRMGWLALLGLLSVSILLFFNGGAFFIPRLEVPAWSNIARVALSTGAMILVVFLPVALLYPALKEPNAPDKRRLIWVLALVICLIAGGAYQVFWEGIWSSAHARAYEDHLPFFQFILSLIAGALIALTLHGRRRWVGAAYVAIVIVVDILALSWGWKVSAFKLTEARAARVNQAIVAYYQDNKSYPDKLSQLTPRYLLYLSPPLIVRQGSWCYQGGAAFYRFGYVSGEFTYSHADYLAKTFAQAGVLPAGDWNCDQQVEHYRSGGLSY